MINYVKIKVHNKSYEQTNISYIRITFFSKLASKNQQKKKKKDVHI